jgi:copper transport protein
VSTRRSRPRTVTSRTVLIAAVVCAQMLAPACAFAHAILVQSQPAPGAELGSSPAQITATFSEPLNQQLSNLTVIGPGGSPVHLRLNIAAGGTALIAQSSSRLARGIYQVRWHSVSADDGHALDGAYYFGVQSSAPQRTSEAQASPLAGTGWLRALLRGVFDAALIAFCGGVLCAAVLARGREPAAWLIPESDPAGFPLADARRLWKLTVRVGVAAVLAGVATTLADAANAAGSLSAHSLHAYLFTDTAGEARVATLAALLVAVGLAARRAPGRASLFVVAALAALSLSGHANSAHPRALAVASDLVHLLAASVWLGGIAQIAGVWLPRVRRLDEPARRAVMGSVIVRFGRIALPAFLTLAVAGVVNAVIELDSLSALWQDGYGRVLIVKIALVGSIALASYLHAIRIRPRLLASNTDLPRRLERRLWRLLASEPLLGAGVALAAAVLVAFPPPRSQRAQRATPQRTLTTPSVPTPLSAAVAPDELSVAEEAGPLIVAAWVTHRAHGGLGVRLHTLGTNEQPLDVPTHIVGATATASCGVGCHTAQLIRSPATLTVQVSDHGGRYSARLPVRWNAGADALARRLLAHVEPGQLALRDVRIHETLRGGPTVPNITDYQLQAPDRFAFTFGRASQLLGETVIIGPKEWERSAGQHGWTLSEYGGGNTFAASTYLGWWTPYAQSPRLMRLERTATATVADIATLSEIQYVGPVWLRLRLDLTHRRLELLRMITAGHFMTQQWGAFNRPLHIQAPPGSPVRPSSAR